MNRPRRLALAVLVPLLACSGDPKQPSGANKPETPAQGSSKAPDGSGTGKSATAAGPKKPTPRPETQVGKRLAGTYVLDREALIAMLIKEAKREDLPAGADEEETKLVVDAARKSAVNWHMQIVLAANQTFTGESREAPRTPMQRISGTWTLTGNKLVLAVDKVGDKEVPDARPMTVTWDDGRIRFPETEGRPFLLVRQ